MIHHIIEGHNFLVTCEHMKRLSIYHVIWRLAHNIANFWNGLFCICIFIFFSDETCIMYIIYTCIMRHKVHQVI